jgi:hypothetical protein
MNWLEKPKNPAYPHYFYGMVMDPKYVVVWICGILWPSLAITLIIYSIIKEWMLKCNNLDTLHKKNECFSGKAPNYLVVGHWFKAPH